MCLNIVEIQYLNTSKELDTPLRFYCVIKSILKYISPYSL